MNVASQQLCKELYELSSWETDDGWDYAGKFRYGLFSSPHENPSRSVPAYDLGYLLRKLEPITESGVLGRLYVEYARDLATGMHYYAAFNSATLDAQPADTPEDAACKLAIELFKQGILKP